MFPMPKLFRDEAVIPRKAPHERFAAGAYHRVPVVLGSNRDEVEAKRQEVAALLGGACRDNDILYSTRILKKTGLRLRSKEGH